MTSSYRRIGVFGGTFDPIHNAHIGIARAAMKSASLEVVLFVVSASPPHKQNGVLATPEQRYRMVEAALEGEDGLEPCDIEMLREGPSYTATTLGKLKSLYPQSELLLIVWLDSLIDIPTWRDPQAIFDLAHILAVSRPDEERAVSSVLDGKYDLVPFRETVASSTEVRRRLRDGESINELIPSRVVSMIKEIGLYAS
jgi:nicotinate-nucleotide adenylyltransferase